MRFLLNASEVLSSSLDYRATLSNVAQIAISQVADYCVVYVAENESSVNVVSVAHRDEAKIRTIERLLARSPFGQSHRYGPQHVIRTGEPQLIPVLTDEPLEEMAANKEQLRFLRKLRVISVMIVPLVARQRILGCMLLATTSDSCRYLGTSDLTVANDLARRASLAIDNARLFTERTTAERALRELTRDMEAVIAASPLPVVHMDLRGRVLRWNPAAERITGWKKEEVIGTLNPMFPEEEDGRSNRLLERLRNGESVDGVVVHRRKRDGSMIDLNKWASPLRNEHGKVQGIVAIYMDVTDRVRFLQVAAHELGNPLSSIKALVTLLKLYVQRDTPRDKIQANLERLDAETDRFTALLDEIISAFRSHQGTLGLQPELTNILEVVKASVHSLGQSDHRVTLNIEGDSALVWGDSRRLQQVMSNLLSNAIKYSDMGTEIVVKTAINEEYIVISVADSGIGIPQAELPLIFEEFYRATEVADGSAGEEASVGIGLGLFICREIILQHNGYIWAESEEGLGTTFYVKLPLATEESPQSGTVTVLASLAGEHA